jgi:hypothetical protein
MVNIWPQIRGEGDDAGMLHGGRGQRIRAAGDAEDMRPGRSERGRGSTADPGAGPGDNHSPAGEIGSRLLPSHRHPFIRCSWNIE